MLIFDPIISTSLLFVFLVFFIFYTAIIYKKSYKPSSKTKKILLLVLRGFSFLMLLFIALRPSFATITEFKQRARLYFLIDISESMSITDMPGNKTRSQAIQEDLEKNKTLIENIKKVYDVKFLNFAQKLRLEKEAVISDKSTAIGTALIASLNARAEMKTSAIVLLSDGVNNSGSSLNRAITDAKHREIPIHTIQYGQDSYNGTLVDGFLKDITCSPFLRENQDLNVVLDYFTRGLKGKTCELNFFIDDKKIHTKKITPSLQEENNTLQSSIKLTDIQPGFHELRVEIESKPGEITPKNNIIRTYFKMRKDGIKVLLLATAPSADFKFLKRIIEETEGVTPTIPSPFLRYTASGRKYLAKLPMHEFDVIIMPNTAYDVLPPNIIKSLKNRMRNRKTGLFVLDGGLFGKKLLIESNPFKEVMPMKIHKMEQYNGKFSWKITSAGLEHFVTQFIPSYLEKNKLKNSKPQNMEGAFLQKLTPKVTAQKLLVDNEIIPNPLLIVDSFGKSKVAYLATNTSWQWHMNENSRKLLHKVFIKRMIYYLASREDALSASLALYSGKTRFELGEKIIINADLLSEKGIPISNKNITVKIKRADGKGKWALISTKSLSTINDLYTMNFSPEIEGLYSLFASTELEGKKIKSNEIRLQIYEPRIEFDQIVADSQTLMQMAKHSKGIYVNNPDITKLLKVLKSKGRVKVIRNQSKKSSLWDNWIVYCLFAFFMGTEWFLRRKFGMP